MNALEVVAVPLLKTLTAVSRRGPSRLVILHYHRVSPVPDPLYPDNLDPGTFAGQIRLVESTFQVLPLGQAIRALASNDLPRNAVCITFDDGYADNFTVAAPILRKYGVVATFFVAAGYLDGGMMWNDRIVQALRGSPECIDLREMGLPAYEPGDAAQSRRSLDKVVQAAKYLPQQEREQIAARLAAMYSASAATQMMMTSRQVRELADAGMEIGAHTMSHPILAKIAPDVAEQEIVQSKIRLEAVTGRPVEMFAYPNGKPGADFGPEHVEMVRRAGFSAAVTTSWGSAGQVSNPFELPRIAPWDRTPLAFAARVALQFR